MTEPRTPEQVGARIRERIDELGLWPAEIKRRGGPPGATLNRILDGLPVKRREAWAGLMKALEWTPGSTQLIRDGLDPVETSPPAEEEELVAMAERIVEMIREFARRATER